MKILNIKLNFKMLISVMFAIILGLSLLYLYRTFFSNSIHMGSLNYTTILKDVHNNIYEYVGKEISLTGYIYRAPDFRENQFVVAQNMKISEEDIRIVGFLCEYSDAKSYVENSWVKIKGIVTMGDYHGPMPILKIKSIRNIKPLENATVPPPNI